MQIKEILQNKTFVKEKSSKTDNQELMLAFHESYNEGLAPKWKRSEAWVAKRINMHPLINDYNDRVVFFNNCLDHKGLNDFAHFFNVMTKTAPNSTKTPPRQRVKVGNDKI